MRPAVGRLIENGVEMARYTIHRASPLIDHTPRCSVVWSPTTGISLVREALYSLNPDCDLNAMEWNRMEWNGMECTTGAATTSTPTVTSI